MTHPRAPRDRALPSDAAPRSIAPGPARDLAPAERLLAARFAALSRAQAPTALAERCLDPRAWTVAPDVGAWRGFAGPLRAPLAWAASLLLAFGVAGLGGSQGPLRTDPVGLASPTASADASALRVVDDPSVPLFHAVETFDRLTPAPLVAWTGSSGSPAGHGGSGEGR